MAIGDALSWPPEKGRMTLYRAALIALGLLLVLIGFLSIDYLNVKKQAAVYSRSVRGCQAGPYRRRSSKHGIDPIGRQPRVNL